MTKYHDPYWLSLMANLRVEHYVQYMSQGLAWLQFWGLSQAEARLILSVLAIFTWIPSVVYCWERKKKRLGVRQKEINYVIQVIQCMASTSLGQGLAKSQQLCGLILDLSVKFIFYPSTTQYQPNQENFALIYPN